MSLDGLKPAELIELHDTGVCIEPENCSSSGAGWREYKCYEGPGFAIAGEDLCHIAQIFGIEPSRVEIKDGKKGPIILDPEFMEFRVRKWRQEVGSKTDSDDYGGMDRVINLWAKIEGPQLLTIRVEYYYDDEDEGRVEYFKQLTYSGSYSVWWKEDI